MFLPSNSLSATVKQIFLILLQHLNRLFLAPSQELSGH
jgi:hypothetical protein